MATNDFQPFGTGFGANVPDQASYLADPMRAAGNQRGIAISALTNKALRQSTFPTAAISQFICDVLGENVSDNGDLAFYEDQFERALAAWIRNIVNCAYIYGCVTPAYIKGIVDCNYIYSCVTPAYIEGIINCTYIQGCVPPPYIKAIIDCAYIQGCVDCNYIYGCVTPAYIEGIINCAYIQSCVPAAPGFPEAPNNNRYYARRNLGWSDITDMFGSGGPTTGGPFIHTMRTVTDVGYPPGSGNGISANVNILTSDWYILWDPAIDHFNNYQIYFNLPSATAGQQIQIKMGIGRDTSPNSIWQGIVRAPGGTIDMVDGNIGYSYGLYTDSSISGATAYSCNGALVTYVCRGGNTWLLG